MPTYSQDRVRNRLLSLMAPADFARLAPKLERVDLPRAKVLIEPGATISDAYFPETGIASLIAITADDRRLEVGLFGREGFGGCSILLGVDRIPYQLFMQVSGHGFRIAASDLIDAAEQSPRLRLFLLRYVQAFSIQTAYTALSNGSHLIGERLARWLLMCHDRLDGDEVAITHEFLGLMLAVRRSGVTDAIHRLEGVGIVKATRGKILVRDRQKLEETAGDSYGVPEAEYERLVGPMRDALGAAEPKPRLPQGL